MTTAREARLGNLLARETTSGRFIPQLDGLRFFAVLAVLVFHIDLWVCSANPTLAAAEDGLHRLLSRGYVGVQFFFAISGFVLALPFASTRLEGASPPRLEKYFFRRLTRLEPPYIINLIIMAIAQALVKGASWAAMLPHLLASICYLHYPLYGEPSTINAVAWSLEIEVQFYLLAPWLTTVFAIPQTSLRRFLIILVIAAFAGGNAWWGPLGNHGFTLAHQLQYFFVGFLLVDFYLVDWKQRTDDSTLWDVAATAAWGLIAWSMVAAPRAAQFLVPACLFIAYGGALRGGFWKRVTGHPAVYTIGGMCYTIYLYNNQIITTLGRITKNWMPAGVSYKPTIVFQAAVLLPAVVLISAVLFVLFEKPFMRRDWLSFGRRRTTTVTPCESSQPAPYG